MCTNVRTRYFDGGVSDIRVASEVTDRIIIVTTTERIDSKGLYPVTRSDILVKASYDKTTDVAADFVAVIGGERGAVRFLTGNVGVEIARAAAPT